MPQKWLYLGLPLLWGLMSCAARPAPTVAPSGPSFLWSVSQGQDTVWLLGSIHLGREEMYPLATNIERAFAQSRELAVEMNIEAEETAQEVAQLLQRQGFLPADSSASQILTPELLQQVDSICASWGLPSDYMHQFRPWFMAVQLSALGVETVGLDAHWGVDVHFMRRAQQRKMGVLALETAQSQVEVFQDLTLGEEVEYLAQTLLELHNLEAQVDSMINFWQQGDTLGMEQFVLGSINAAGANLKDKIYAQRNVKMAQQISRWLGERRRVFVVVGAAHFVGPQSILVYLRDQGLQVEQH